MEPERLILLQLGTGWSTAFSRRAIACTWPIPRLFDNTKDSNIPTTNGTLSGWLNCSCLASCRKAISYPKADRPTRDLLRRRLLFVHQRTAHILSLQSMVDRWGGRRIPVNQIKQLTPTDAEALFSDTQLVRKGTLGERGRC